MKRSLIVISILTFMCLSGQGIAQDKWIYVGFTEDPDGKINWYYDRESIKHFESEGEIHVRVKNEFTPAIDIGMELPVDNIVYEYIVYCDRNIFKVEQGYIYFTDGKYLVNSYDKQIEIDPGSLGESLHKKVCEEIDHGG